MAIKTNNKLKLNYKQWIKILNGITIIITQMSKNIDFPQKQLSQLWELNIWLLIIKYNLSMKNIFHPKTFKTRNEVIQEGKYKLETKS